MKKISLMLLFAISFLSSSFLVASSLQVKSFNNFSLVKLHADADCENSANMHNVEHSNCNNHTKFYKSTTCSYESCNISFQALPVFLTPSLNAKPLSVYVLFNSYFSSYKTPSLIKPPSIV